MLQTKDTQTKKALATPGRPAAGQVKPVDPDVTTVRKTAGGGAISPEERHRMIAEAAYFHALERGLDGGDPLGDWLAAEKQVEAMLSREKS
jgi:hypothetical protein